VDRVEPLPVEAVCDARSGAMSWPSIRQSLRSLSPAPEQALEPPIPRFVHWAARAGSISRSATRRAVGSYRRNRVPPSTISAPKGMSQPRANDRIVIRQDGEVVGEHPRRFGRDQTLYDPWHYVPVLARKPGAWRNGAPFKDWVLPGALEGVRKRLIQVDDGGRQMVETLSAVTTDGLGPVEAACACAAPTTS
jgi:hypothetical protein